MTMRVGVLDVGSNTIRLLVADVQGGSVVPVETGRVRLSLGEEIERHGVVSATSIRAAAKAVRKFRALAARHGVDEVDVFLTAPGRQAANADELVAALRGARVLTTDEEGRLAYRGAMATADGNLLGSIGVVDVGGASTEIAVGSRGADPAWVESVDLGSVRLTTRSESLAAARAEVEDVFAHVTPPRVGAALTVGGTARAARRLVGAWLGPAELAEALHLVETLDPRDLTRRFGVDRNRAHILPGGVAILAEVQHLLGVPLHVCDGGIREGAALTRRAVLAA
jgi:exopolyphosphatase / guanosine-5'-triphosphate,3'-diphosphate pyrophosphatase